MFLLEFLSKPELLIIFLLSLVLAVTVHEFTHAWTADRLGDPTPGLMGRLTLNPAAHLDPIGSLLFLFIGFGWGKPVPYDPFNLKDPRRDAALISVAGPLSNFIMALTAAIIIRLLNLVELNYLISIGYLFLIWFIRINIILGIVNLLPFAPLDGFQFVGGLLSKKQSVEWFGLQRFGLLFLLFFIFPFANGRSMLEILLSPVINTLISFLIPGIR